MLVAAILAHEVGVFGGGRLRNSAINFPLHVTVMR
jgi:hypothetical protein